MIFYSARTMLNTEILFFIVSPFYR